MLKRKFYDFLMDWKSSEIRKPLLVKGQRQVGKTFIIREFAKTYEHSVEINFLENPSLKEIFEGDLDVVSIISKMKLYFDKVQFEKGSTMIFLDEIQECPKARTSMKWFAEDGSYDVIASGSLLGVCDNLSGQGCSVPVGYEKTVEMRALDFEEFLLACNIPEEAITKVRSCLREHKEIPTAYLDVFQKRFREFLVVGGMPESVQRFVDTGDYLESREILLNLVESTRADINKYNVGVNRIKTGECYDSIPYQLDQGNKKFMYSRISGEGSRKSAEKYMDNLLWIKGAGYGIFCNALYGIGKPLARNVDRSSFRVYLSDTGTLTNLYGLNSVRAVLSSDFTYNMGAVMENAVAECIVKSGYVPVYYRKTSGDDRMEIDFLVEMEDGPVAIEVKSGKHREAPSLGKLDNECISRKIMFREGNIKQETEDIIGYPLFAAAFMRDFNFS